MKIYTIIEYGKFGIFIKVVGSYVNKKAAETECERRNTSKRFRNGFEVVQTYLLDYDANWQ